MKLRIRAHLTGDDVALSYEDCTRQVVRLLRRTARVRRATVAIREDAAELREQAEESRVELADTAAKTRIDRERRCAATKPKE